jgi:hypothetical protein
MLYHLLTWLTSWHALLAYPLAPLFDYRLLLYSVYVCILLLFTYTHVIRSYAFTRLPLYTYVSCFYLRMRMYVHMRSIACLCIRIRMHFSIAFFCIVYVCVRWGRWWCYRAHKRRRERERETERERSLQVVFLVLAEVDKNDHLDRA